MKKKLAIAFISLGIILTGCSEADTVSHNLSKSADSFEVQRRVVFFNGITDKYLLTIEGLCALGNSDKQDRLSVTCKVGEDSYKKHYLGLSDNVSFLVEQTDAVTEDPFHYRMIFRPEAIIPDIDLQTSGN
ncbi:beta-sandwich lipoprotein [Halalkalibacter oceani]|uniref:beta-sandwich lipoprotein n=1 Tax=Halalkalibacter oceani TaxID=1653776 RepID=UPI00339471B7